MGKGKRKREKKDNDERDTKRRKVDHKVDLKLLNENNDLLENELKNIVNMIFDMVKHCNGKL